MAEVTIKRTSDSGHFAKVLPYILTVVMTAIFVAIAIRGASYYLTPVYDTPQAPGRMFHPLHAQWSSSGTTGHTLGVIGTLMMLSIYIYVARKRVKFMRNWGSIRIWLQLHIMMGLCGPILVMYHSTGKLDQQVPALSFWAMWGVVASGIVGRWLYSQIPKSMAGTELSMHDLEAEDRRLVGALRKELGLNHSIFEHIDAISATSGDDKETGAIQALQIMLRDDISRFKQIRDLKRRVRSEGLSREKTNEIVKLAKRKSLLMRKIRLLGAAHALFDWWHVFHKPLGYLMYGTLLVHIVVVVLLGYRWIF